MRGRIAPVGWSIALHAVLAGLLYFGLTLPSQEPQETMLPIDAVVVDQQVLESAGRERAAAQREALEERRREEARAEAERLEQERIARETEQKRQEEQQRLEAERQARADAEAKRKAEEEARIKAEEEARAKAAAEKERAVREARLRAEREQREADLREQLAEEEARASPGYQSLKASYVAAIQRHVERRWYEPPGTSQGLVCRIFVMQIPGGEVVGTRFGACNGNAAVRQSIETAVRNSSPLPAPPDPSLFEREVELVFTPKESRQ